MAELVSVRACPSWMFMYEVLHVQNILMALKWHRRSYKLCIVNCGRMGQQTLRRQAFLAYGVRQIQGIWGSADGVETLKSQTDWCQSLALKVSSILNDR